MISNLSKELCGLYYRYDIVLENMYLEAISCGGKNGLGSLQGFARESRKRENGSMALEKFWNVHFIAVNERRKIRNQLRVRHYAGCFAKAISFHPYVDFLS